MRKRRESGRRLWMAIGLGVALALFAGGLAFASTPIIGDSNNQYSGAPFTIDQGEVAQLNVTGSSHNATAHQTGPDGKALFRSPTISGGTTGVNGTQYLTSGSYTFFCTIHPSTMQATLNVSSNGTPQARPRASLSLKSRKLAKALKKGLLVGINASTKIDGVGLVAKLGKTTIGQVNSLSLAAGQQFDRLKLSKAGKSKLRGRSTAKVTVTVDIPFGSPASVKAKLS